MTAMIADHGAQADETQLWAALKVHGQASARERLFLQYAPLAFKIARRCHTQASGSTVELNDVKQWASAGLLEAIDGFDQNKGTPFAAYAPRRIRGSVLDGLSRASEYHEQLSARARWRKQRLDSLTATIDAAQPEDALGKLVELAIGVAISFMLDDTTLYREENAPERGPSAYESLAWKETLAALKRVVADLPDPERAVIRHHYGGELSFTDIASLLGVSKGRVSQIHRSALAALRRCLRRSARFAV
jgi:RNA polymerase sigma factor for flagellar operon FliA